MAISFERKTWVKLTIAPQLKKFMKTKQEIIADIEQEIEKLLQKRDKPVGVFNKNQEQMHLLGCNSQILAYRHCLELIQQLPE